MRSYKTGVIFILKPLFFRIIYSLIYLGRIDKLLGKSNKPKQHLHYNFEEVINV